jgi:pyruvate/2-oxoglutarate dehydrogenase complex dihydrolipoamide acyltransferase (E2) component
VNLGDLGEGTKEATLKQWFIKPGSEVKEVILFNEVK